MNKIKKIKKTSTKKSSRTPRQLSKRQAQKKFSTNNAPKTASTAKRKTGLIPGTDRYKCRTLAEKQQEFLNWYQHHGQWHRACRAARVCNSTVRKWCEDPQYWEKVQKQNK